MAVFTALPRSRFTPPRRRSARTRACLAAAAGAAVLLCLTVGGCLLDFSPGGGNGGPIDTDEVIGGLGDSPGRFAYPRGIDTDGESLWVVDMSARIQRLDPKTGECLSIWRMPQSAAGKPVGLTVAPAVGGGRALYVPDTHYHRVMIFAIPPAPDPATVTPQNRYDGTPEPLAVFGSYGEGPGQFIYPTDIAVLTGQDNNAVERIYVSEYGGHDRVSVFDPDLKFMFSFGTFGSGSSPDSIQFDRPQSIEIDAAKKRLIVVDARNHRIGRFTLDGKLLGWIGSPEAAGDVPGQMKYPYGLSLLGDDTALVTEYGNNRVQRLNLDTGKSLGIWGQPGRGPGQLATPWAIAVLGRETYVVDSANNRVLAMRTPGGAGR